MRKTQAKSGRRDEEEAVGSARRADVPKHPRGRSGLVKEIHRRDAEKDEKDTGEKREKR
jgi:hypothetical protein